MGKKSKTSSSDAEATPWYADGLRFECSECGDCCTGAPGYVWVNKADIERMAGELGLDVERFERKYVRLIGVRKSLIEFANGDCVFFDSQRRHCKVYASRPRQCQTWPFWHSNLRSPDTWAETCEACPGSGNGKLHEIGQIEQQRRVVRV